MTFLEKQVENIKKKKTKVKTGRMMWIAALIQKLQYKRPHKNYADLDFNFLIVTLFLTIYSGMKIETIKRLLYTIYSKRSTAKNLKKYLENSMINEKEFIIDCAVYLYSSKKKIFHATNWLYYKSICSFDNVINEEEKKEFLKSEIAKELIRKIGYNKCNEKVSFNNLNNLLKRREYATA